jgi:hypothetical protein
VFSVSNKGTISVVSAYVEFLDTYGRTLIKRLNARRADAEDVHLVIKWTHTMPQKKATSVKLMRQNDHNLSTPTAKMMKNVLLNRVQEMTMVMTIMTRTTRAALMSNNTAMLDEEEYTTEILN